MTQSRTPASPSADGILAAVAHAEHLRRGRAATRLLSRIVPAVTGGLVIAAAAIRFFHLPLAVFWILAAAVTAGVLALAWFARRVPAVTDAVAAQLDTDASLGGELHSAHWFAAREVSDAWTAFHLDAAADRVQQVSWPSVYPPVKAARAWAGSIVLGLSAVALALSTAWPGSHASTPARTTTAPVATATESVIPADLQKELDELLKSIGNGSIPLDAARTKISDLREELSKLDPQMLDALAHATSGQPPQGGADAKPSDPQAADLAARAEKSADNDDLPGDMKWSLQDLAAKLNKASMQAAGPNTQTGTPSKDKGAADGKAPQAQPDAAQSTRVTTADSSSNLMMAAAAGPPGSDPGATSDAARKLATRQPLDLSGSLRKEAVEANEDSAGANVLAEMRRKSEQSHSTIEFSHVAPLAAYDKSHASAPPAPPDALRALVQQYFIRR